MFLLLLGKAAGNPLPCGFQKANCFQVCALIIQRPEVMIDFLYLSSQIIFSYHLHNFLAYQA